MWLTWLDDAARDTGFPVILSPGWQTRGHGQMSLCEGVVGHHTGTPASVKGDYPTLAVVRDGRSGLPGPLSHLGLGRSGTVYVIAAGTCYHAGTSAHAGYTNLNNKYVGIEAENDGSGNWTAAQLDAYPKLVAACLYRMHRGPERYASHRTVAKPAGRKADPARMSDAWMRGTLLPYLQRLMGGKPVDGWESGAAGLPTLRRGENNDDVKALQSWMGRMFPSYVTFEATGYYGEQTQAAVREFQRRMNITGPDADGSIVGPRTNQELWDLGYRGRR